MSTKDFEEKQEIVVNVRRTICDVCGEVVKDGTVKLRLAAERETLYHHMASPYSLKETASSPIDICSVDCLVSNLGGLTLLLRSKVIPSVPEHRKGGPAYVGTSVNDSGTPRDSLLTDLTS